MFSLTYDEEQRLLDRISLGMLLISVLTFLVLYHVIPAPWGKTLSHKVGPLLPARASWLFFENPHLIWSYLCWRQRRKSLSDINQFLLMLFVIHYAQRAIIYPIFLSNNTRKMPAAVVLCGFAFTTVNGYLQSQSLCQFEYYPDDWCRYFQFRLGIFLFAIGFGVNLHSDAILRQLRNGSAKYQIPYGGLFEYVSAPHYFGEMIEWTGYALACNSLASLAFLVYAASNLIPRGVAHHAWYKSFFPDYPNERKAIIPFIW